MADGLFWRCLSCLSGPWQWELLELKSLGQTMQKNKTLHCFPSKRWKLHLVEFELNISFCFTQMRHRRACSARVAQNSCIFRKRSCAESYKKCRSHRHAKRRHAHQKRTSANTAMMSYLARAPKRTCGRVRYKSAFSHTTRIRFYS